MCWLYWWKLSITVSSDCLLKLMCDTFASGVFFDANSLDSTLMPCMTHRTPPPRSTTPLLIVALISRCWQPSSSSFFQRSSKCQYVVITTNKKEPWIIVSTCFWPKEALRRVTPALSALLLNQTLSTSRWDFNWGTALARSEHATCRYKSTVAIATHARTV